LCGESKSNKLISIPPFQYVQCKKCNLVYLNPRPKQDSLERIYLGDTDKATDISKDPTGEQELYFFRFSDRLKDIGRLKEKGRILDIGSSWGHFLHVAKTNGWDAYGVDPSLAQAEHARRKFGLNVFMGQLKGAGFPSRNFDVITLWHVLEHIPSPFEEIAEIKRVLKTDGLLAVEIPSVRRLKDDINKQKFSLTRPPLHLFYYSISTLTLLLEKAGFRVIQIRECGDTEILKGMDDLGVGFAKSFVVRNFRYLKWLKRIFQSLRSILKIHRNIVVYAKPNKDNSDK
jgi:SAM-dependent methyltransferase